MDKKQQVRLVLSTETHKQLKILAKKSGLTISSYIRMALMKMLEKNDKT